MDSLKFGFTEVADSTDDYIHSYEGESGIFLQVDLYINEKLINSYIDPVAFLYPPTTEYVTYNCWYNGTMCVGKYIGRLSDFYPFNCSCGHAGCAGIWDGIYVKERKHTIEWRVPENKGYGFLDKRFYSFDRSAYMSEIDRLKDVLRSRPDRLLSDWETCGEVVKRLML